ncbi:MAG: hypothetical protein HOB14_10580 [Gammaproteobacteria bacterium]|nr:hypothetical protein [Gammaproteobacteria bacterium]MBT6702094.1 hypothetical protein [Gammaproteobacteria bacterium]MBT7043958.1 hypothetical protein [Gammaproteobacteria bacterium]
MKITVKGKSFKQINYYQPNNLMTVSLIDVLFLLSQVLISAGTTLYETGCGKVEQPIH